MNTRPIWLYLKRIVLFLVLSCGVSSYAASNALVAPAQKGHVVAGKRRGVAGSSNGQVDESLLQQAYQILEKADHDYKGHRIKAMREIESVARLMGVNLHGVAPGM